MIRDAAQDTALSGDTLSLLDVAAPLSNARPPSQSQSTPRSPRYRP
jgi:hypothetical protein